jgi:MFS family permease
LSTAAFLGTDSTAWLFVARITSGACIGLLTGAATAWIVELHPGRDRVRANQLAAVSNLLGLGLGPLVAGPIADFAPPGLRAPYWIFLVLIALAALIAAFIRESVAKKERPSFKPHIGVPKDLRGAFVAPAIAAFATFAVLGFYTSLIPSVLPRAMHHSSHALAGGIVAMLFLLAGAVTAALPRALSPRTGMVIGIATLIPGVVLLVVADLARSLALLVSATFIGGVAVGFGYVCGLRVINELAPNDQRSALISTYLMVCYAAISLPVIGTGLLAAATGPDAALLVFGIIVTLLAAAALVFEIVSERMPHLGARA